MVHCENTEWDTIFIYQLVPIICFSLFVGVLYTANYR